MASATNCRLIKNGVNDVLLNIFIQNGTILSNGSVTNFTSLLSAAAGPFGISEDCLKVKSGTSYYEYSSGTPTLIGSTGSITAMDKYMKYALASSNIMKYNSVTKQFALLFSNANVTFSVNATIHSYGNRVVVVDYNWTNAEVYAFVDNSGSLTEIFMHNAAGFDSTPTAYISQQMTKILIYGLSGSQADGSLFFVDYDGL